MMKTYVVGNADQTLFLDYDDKGTYASGYPYLTKHFNNAQVFTDYQKAVREAANSYVVSLNPDGNALNVYAVSLTQVW